MKADPRNLLLIAYYFPPLGGSGSLRPMKLAKYLPAYNWHPIVLTVRNPDWYYALDPGLIDELPPSVVIKKCLMFKSSWVYRMLNPLRFSSVDKFIRRFILHPDEQIGWVPFAMASAKKLVREKNIKVIYSTSGPMSCHLIASHIKKKTGLPWVADFRDEWYEAPNLIMPTRFHRRMHFCMEKAVVENADKIITMAPIFEKLLSKHNGNQKKFETITAGFDPEDRTVEAAKGSGENFSKKFIISFTGLFYDSFRPQVFVDAILDLVANGKIPAENIRIRFVGANTPDEIRFSDKYGIFEFTGFVPRKRALKYLSESDALLLLLSKERGKDVIPSKTFEYMASGIPIIAIVPSNGKVAEMIATTQTGIVADFEDSEAIKNVLLNLYKAWDQNKLIRTNPKVQAIDQFNQKSLVKKFTNIINEMVK